MYASQTTPWGGLLLRMVWACGKSQTLALNEQLARLKKVYKKVLRLDFKEQELARTSIEGVEDRDMEAGM